VQIKGHETFSGEKNRKNLELFGYFEKEHLEEILSETSIDKVGMKLRNTEEEKKCQNDS
jgi:hypothetical protein